MLGCPSISSIDVSEQEYVPQTAEESDSSAESIVQPKSKKKKARKTTSGNSQKEVQQVNPQMQMMLKIPLHLIQMTQTHSLHLMTTESPLHLIVLM